MARVIFASRIPMPAEALFHFRQDPWNVTRMSPRFPRVDVHAASRPVEEGDVQALHVQMWRRRYRLRLRITQVVAPRRVVDEQIEGPFRAWRHQHVVLARGEQESVLADVIDFRYFGGPIGPLLDWLVIAPLMRLYFSAQHRHLRHLFGRPRGWRRHIPIGR